MTTREILEQVKLRIIANPSTYEQRSFCGTQCCIAGHIDVIINGLEVHNERLARDGYAVAVETIEGVANNAIGERASPWLFGSINTDEGENDPDEDQDPDYWPLDLSIEYDNATSASKRAVVGCKAIDRYLEERGL